MRTICCASGRGARTEARPALLGRPLPCRELPQASSYNRLEVSSKKRFFEYPGGDGLRERSARFSQGAA
jgi:hypothetical protein